MGRYDKIRVKTDSSFVQPRQIYVKRPNGLWADLGDNNSYVTTPMYTKNSYGAFIRATLNRKDTTKYTNTGATYSTGSFQLLPTNGYCYQPLSTNYPTYSCDCYFRATVRKTEDVDQVIFHTYRSGVGQLKIVWKASGHIEVTTQYNSSTYTLVSSNAVGKDNWVDIDYTVYRGNTGVQRLTFNGVLTTKTGTGTFLSTGPTNVVGDTYIQFKDTMSVQMYNRANKKIQTAYINFSISNGSSDNTHTAFGVANLPVPYTEVTWV